MVEDLFVDPQDERVFGASQLPERSTLQLSQGLGEDAGVAQRSCEVQGVSLAGHDDARVAGVEQRANQRAAFSCIVWKPVHLHETRQLPVRIQQVALLVGAIEVARAQRVEHLDALVVRE